MGAYLNKPVLDKKSYDGTSTNFRYGVSSMQGWRIDMEDTDTVVPDLDDNTAFFAVFDGHGGREVACYLAEHMPKFLLQANSYTDGDLESALKEAYLDADRALLTDEGQDELKKLMKTNDSQEDSCSDSEQEQVEAVELLEEADMPLEDLLAKYGCAGRVEDTESKDSGDGRSSEEGDDKEVEDGDKETDSQDKRNQAIAHLKSIAADAGLNVNIEELEDGGSSSGTQKKKRKPTRVTRTATRTVRAVDDAGLGNLDQEEESSDESGIEYDEETVIPENPEESGSSSSDEAEEDSQLKTPMKECGFESGSTAVIALLRGRELYVSSAGDSRCVMCCRGETVALSVDHKPEDEKELKRITEAGGMVDHTGRVNRGLNLSRAIGDHLYKQNKQVKLEDQMISALPDVYHETLSSDHSFMILASDGIWNMMTSEQSVEYVKEHLVEDSEGDLSHICEQMIDHCLAPDKTGDGSGCDNMTVVIVQFLHESTEESKSTFVSPTKGKSLGKRPAPSGSEIDSNEQVKRSRLETKPSQ